MSNSIFALGKLALTGGCPYPHEPLVTNADSRVKQNRPIGRFSVWASDQEKDGGFACVLPNALFGEGVERSK